MIKDSRVKKNTYGEQKIQSAILQRLDSLNIFHFKTIACNKRGIPDIVSVVGGRAVFFEVKRPGGKTSPLQDYQMNQIILSGGAAYVVTSVDEVNAILKNYGIIN